MHAIEDIGAIMHPRPARRLGVVERVTLDFNLVQNLVQLEQGGVVLGNYMMRIE